MTEENRRIVQFRLISNLLRSIVWITSGLLTIFKSLLVFSQQVSLSLFIGLRFCVEESPLYPVDLVLWCFGFRHSSLTKWQLLNHIRYCCCTSWQGECTNGGWRKRRDESMQEEADEGRRPMFGKSENQPSSQEMQEHMKTHFPRMPPMSLGLGRGRKCWRTGCMLDFSVFSTFLRSIQK